MLELNQLFWVALPVQLNILSLDQEILRVRLHRKNCWYVPSEFFDDSYVFWTFYATGLIARNSAPFVIGELLKPVSAISSAS